MKKILVVVDMQNDFITGSLGSDKAISIVPNVVNKIIEYRNNDDYIIFTRDLHFDDYLDTQEGKLLPIKHCICETKGSYICPEIEDILGDSCHYPVINKESFGTFILIDKINDYIGGNSIPQNEWEIEFVGLCLDICVISNAIMVRSHFHEAKTIIDLDCTAATSEKAFEASVEVAKSCQIFLERMSDLHVNN